MTVTFKSFGSMLPRRESIFCRTFSEMSVAFAPLRLASVIVTAGYSAFAVLASRSLGAGKQDVAVGFGGAVLDLFHHIAQVHGPSGVNSHDDLLQFFRAREEVAGFDLKLLVVARKAARLTARVRGSELHDDGTRRQAVRCEALRVQHNAQFAAAARR